MSTIFLPFRLPSITPPPEFADGVAEVVADLGLTLVRIQYRRVSTIVEVVEIIDAPTTEAFISSVNALRGIVVDGVNQGSGLGNGGKIINIVHAAVPVATANTKIPLDNSAPLITEGTQVVSLGITPQSLSNKVLVQVSFTFARNSDDKCFVAALFRGVTYIAAQSFNAAKKKDTRSGHLQVVDTPSSIIPVIYTMRVGSDDGNDWYLNRNKDNNDQLGGKRAVTGQFILTEFAP